MAQGVGMGPHGHMVPAGPPGMGDTQGGIPDPMNALQNLARQGGQPPPQQGKQLCQISWEVPKGQS